MPAISPTAVLNNLINGDTATNILQPRAVNATSNALQVVCAWPVSGQYGPGSRILYYVLVAACVLARKTDWLRNACLAAALLFPAVAAIHGIVLAAAHVNGAVDMDVYGAFQLCSIGILAAPVTVRLSRTYFNDPGRNVIFVWTGLILTGLISLTVEFYRTQTSDCTHDDSGNPIAPSASAFPYGDDSMCNITCSIDQGPHSPIRGGSANNIYIIPAPDKLTFGTATLIAAACCIPAILSMVSMWDKILEINWKTRFGTEDDRINEPIEGTNGATVANIRKVNNKVRLFLSVIEIPLFGGAVLAILITGEMNFFSDQVQYQTEPIASIGQWAPIAGTGLAALGSLYLLLTGKADTVEEESNSSMQFHHGRPSEDRSPSSRGLRGTSSHSRGPPEISNLQTGFSMDLTHTISQSVTLTGDAGSRRRVARWLTTAGNYLSTAAHDQLEDGEFRRGRAQNFPEIPGEEQRNPALPQIRGQYNQHRDSDGHISPMLHERRSTAGSYAGSMVSGIEGNYPGVRIASPRAQSPLPSPTSPRRPYASILQTEQAAEMSENPEAGSSADATRDRVPHRRDTLEVPAPVHHRPT